MTEYRYKAFISYAHANERWADWLHRGLETYRVPKNLVGAETAQGPVPERLTPIFRDRDDLPAAGSLNDTIMAALKDSEFLIVLASPQSAQSKWVREEIRHFKRMHGPDRVLAVIIDGEPFASERDDVDSTLECFPDTLRVNEAEDGSTTPAEPLAADARRDKDGKRHALTKIAAGLVGVPLDGLVQREAQRRTQRMQGLVALFGGLTILFGGMAWFAVEQRDEARDQRRIAEAQRGIAETKTAEAEDLIEFMITDLKDNLKPVGRLDILDTVVERAVQYYDNQSEEDLDADALGRRSRAYLAVGAIDQDLNKLDEALDVYERAAATTAALLERAPDDPQRVFEHAQSVFYVGYVHRQRGNLDKAEDMMLAYLALAERLNELEPGKTRSILEIAYATNNLGILKKDQRAYDQAVTFFERSASARKALYESTPNSRRLLYAYATSLSWLASAESSRGNFDKAAELFSEEIAAHERLLKNSPDNFRYVDLIAIAKRRLASAFLWSGNMKGAEEAANDAVQFSNSLTARDPQNASWKMNASYSLQLVGTIAVLSRTDTVVAKNAAHEAINLAESALSADNSNLDAKTALASARALSLLLERDQSVAAVLEDDLQQLKGHNTENALIGMAAAASALTNHYVSSQQFERANTLRDDAIARLSKEQSLPNGAKLSLLELYVQAGDLQSAEGMAAHFGSMSARHPKFLELQNRLRAGKQ